MFQKAVLKIASVLFVAACVPGTDADVSPQSTPDAYNDRNAGGTPIPGRGAY